MSLHLTVRVAWHQERWNGTVCQQASGNSYCLDLKRIREEYPTHSDGKILFPFRRLFFIAYRL